jgi:hypothetical protein
VNVELTLANPVTVNPDVGKSGSIYEKIENSVYTRVHTLKIHVEFRNKRDSSKMVLQTLLRAAGESCYG